MSCEVKHIEQEPWPSLMPTLVLELVQFIVMDYSVVEVNKGLWTVLITPLIVVLIRMTLDSCAI